MNFVLLYAASNSGEILLVICFLLFVKITSYNKLVEIHSIVNKK